jgi:type 1 fimbria pilin
MKKLMIVAALGLIVSSQTFAAGSKITNSTIKNKANVANSTNTAGAGGEANMASIKIKDADIRNSTISNDATIRNSTNKASGGKRGGGFGLVGGKSGGKANMGSIVVE